MIELVEILEAGASDTALLEKACHVIEDAQNYEHSLTGITYNTHGLTAEELSEHLRREAGVCLLAKDREQVIGTLTLLCDRRGHWFSKKEEDAPRVIKYVAVSPNSQGRGIAGMLVQRSLSLVDNLVTVSTDERNVHAVHLYEKNGFIRVEYARPRGAESNAVGLAFWKRGCPIRKSTISLQLACARIKCLIKALIFN